MTIPSPQRRWFHPPPSWLVLGLMVVEGLLWLSDRFEWPIFNHQKGWTVLIAVAAVGATTLLMLLWFIASLLFRWRFQFSIRSLLVLVVAVAIPCSWLAVERESARKQAEVVNEIENVGGSIEYLWQVDADGTSEPNARPPGPVWMRNLLGVAFFGAVVHVNLGNTSVTDAKLEHIRGLTQLQSLHLHNTQVTDRGLGHLSNLAHLKELRLDRTQVTDIGLEHLKCLAHLQYLDLDSTRITDIGLEHLNGVTQLRYLQLSNTNVTDTGLSHLRGLAHLEWLDLDNTKVTDTGLTNLEGLTQLDWLLLDDTRITNVGLGHLEGMTQLRHLYIRSTKVTDAGVKKLSQALPTCEIIR